MKQQFYSWLYRSKKNNRTTEIPLEQKEEKNEAAKLQMLYENRPQ